MIERYAFKFGKFVKKTKHYGKNKLDKASVYDDKIDQI